MAGGSDSDTARGRKRGKKRNTFDSDSQSGGDSPRRPPSPGSDDDGITVPIEEDTGSSSAAAPLIRQPVAFSRDKSLEKFAGEAATYQADLPTASSVRFLPGQEPQPVPSSSRGQGAVAESSTHGKKTSARSRTPRKPFNDGFSEQTQRFRVRGYVNEAQTPASGEPPVLGSNTGQPGQFVHDLLSMDISTPATMVRQQAAPPSRPPSSTRSSQSNQTTPSSSRHRHIQPAPSRSRAPAAPHSVPIPSSNPPSRPPPSNPIGSRQSGRPSPSGGDRHHSFATSERAPETSTRGYRQFEEARPSDGRAGDYHNAARGHSIATSAPGSPAQSPGASPAFSHSPLVNYSPQTAPAHSSASSAADPARRPGSPVGANPNVYPAPTGTTRGPPPRLRMLTLLIDDQRGSGEDHQLAEVRVSLRPADYAEDGFWADAGEVCTALQSGPGRIDGPARVYTHRGKYRQFFLRVSADNVDKCDPVNLKVTRDRTLEVVVEALSGASAVPSTSNYHGSPDPLYSTSSAGAGPSNVVPQKRGRNLTGEVPRSIAYEPVPSRSYVAPPSQTPVREQKRSRRDSETSYDMGSYGSAPGPSHTSYESRLDPNGPDRGYGYNGGGGGGGGGGGQRASYPSSPTRQYSHARPGSSHARVAAASSYSGTPPAPAPMSPTASSWHTYSPPPSHIEEVETDDPEPSPEAIDSAIVGYVKPMIEDDPRWMDYMKSKAVPQTVPEMVRQYRFVQAKMELFKDKMTPIGMGSAGGRRISKRHVLKALGLPDFYGDECNETLWLLTLYGQYGKRYEDARVVKMEMEEYKSGMQATGKEMRKMVAVLREIHGKWMEDHPGDLDLEEAAFVATRGKTKQKTKAKAR